MFKPYISKIGEVKTPIGWASVLRVNGTRLLAFPSFIDPQNTISMNTYYGTLRWPRHMPVSRISEFLPGPAVPGYLLTSLEQLYTEQSHEKDNRPRHVREFLSNVLAGLAASMLAGKG
jgi:hypothetical protein